MTNKRFSQASLAAVVCLGVIVCFHAVHSDDQPEAREKTVLKTAADIAPPAPANNSSVKDAANNGVDRQAVWVEVRATRADVRRILELLAAAEARPGDESVLDSRTKFDHVQLAPLIETLHRPRPRVRVVAHFFDVAVDQIQTLGLEDDEFRGGVHNTRAIRRDIRPLIAALLANDGARLLARTNLVAFDRSAANFWSLVEIPAQQLTENSAGGSISATAFRDAVVTLSVLPRITRNGSISLEVSPGISDLHDFMKEHRFGHQPTTSTVHVQDGQSVVIGRLRSTGPRVPHATDQAPPKDTELLIFLTAELMTPKIFEFEYQVVE